VLFGVMSLVWGVSYLFIKVAVQSLPVPVIVFVRCAGAALVLLPFVARAGWGKAARAVRAHWPWLIGFAVLEMIGPWWLLTSAERTISSSMAGLIIAAVPIIGIGVARLAGDREQLGLLRWAGLLVGLVGVGVLAAPALHGGAGWALVEMALVALGYATAPVLAVRRLGPVPGLVMATACLAFAGIVYTPAAVLAWPSSWPSIPVLAALVGLTVVSTALAFVAFFALLREVGTARGMVFTYVNPAVAVVAGVLVLGEPLTPSIVGGFALIMVGSLLVTAVRPRPRRSAPATPAATPGQAR
jgi:drug/metabolite transporter (DMT)-like permease